MMYFQKIVLLVMTGLLEISCLQPSLQREVTSLQNDNTATEVETQDPSNDDPQVLEDSAIRIINVSNSLELTVALASAKPGDQIQMADGDYIGNFKATKNGTQKNPIKLFGSKKAVIKGKNLNKGYGFFLNANHYLLLGFSIENFKKGIVIENANNNVLAHLSVNQLGEEGIHLRKFSSKNKIIDSEIKNTGLVNPGFGEGIYVGSATNHWCEFANCKPDKSDNNILERNSIHSTSAEPIDIKEGTTGTIVKNNSLDGNGLSGANAADSLIDIKGNKSIIKQNQLKNSKRSSLQDALQIHVKAEGWGQDTIISENTLVDAIPGFGITIDKQVLNGTIINCDNDFRLAKSGLGSYACK